MATYQQLPAALDLALVAGDEFTFSATFDINLAGYVVTAGIFKQVDGSTILTPTLAVTPGSLSSTVALTLSETQTSAIYAAAAPQNGIATARVRWFLRWQTPQNYTRTVLSGLVRIGTP